jgi:hypothetical protein
MMQAAGNSIKYGDGLVVDSEIMNEWKKKDKPDECCDFLINNKVYYFKNNKITSCRTTDLVINKISKEYVLRFSERACEKALLNIIDYYKKHRQNSSFSMFFPLSILLKNEEINRIIDVDKTGCVRAYYGIIRCPEKYIIKLPESKHLEVNLEEIIQV